MSTTLLYNMFGIRGYDYQRTDYHEGSASFVIEQPRAKSERPALQDSASETVDFKSSDTKVPVEREPGSDDDQPIGRKSVPPLEKTEGKAASKSALRVVEVKLKQAGLTEKDLEEKFGFGLAGITLSTINNVLEFIKERAA